VVHTVTPNEDVYLDPTSVSATISTATGGNFEHLVINPAAAVTQITDTIDDTTVTLTATPSITEAGTSITYTATLDHPAQAGSPVTVTLSNNEVITIAGGASSGFVVHTVTPNEDVYLDPTSVSATISTATGGNFEHLVVGTGTATAQVNDTITDATVDLSASAGTNNEGSNYTLIFGTVTNPKLESIADLDWREVAIFAPLIASTLVLGVYPSAVFNLTQSSVDHLVSVYQAAIGG